VLGTVYGTLSRSGDAYSFVSNQSYTSDVTFADGTRFAAAFLNDTFNPLMIGSQELLDDATLGSNWTYVLLDSEGKPAFAVDKSGTFFFNSFKRFDNTNALADFTTDALSEGSANLYYTEARARDSFTNAFADFTTDALSEGSTNLYFTDARARASFSVTGVSGISYDPSTGALNTDVTGDISPTKITLDGSVTDDESQWGNRWDYSLLDSANKPAFGIDGTGGAYVNSLSTFNGALIGGDSEEVGNRFAFLQLDNNNIPAYGVDKAGVFYVNSIKTFDGSSDITDSSISSTDDLTEGTSNLYYTDTRSRAAITAQEEAGLDYDSSTGQLKSIDGDANRVIVKWGDSISADISNSELLAQLDPGREMLFRATGGIDNGSILARFGALPITGRCYWDVKTVTVVSHTGAVVTLSPGDTTDIEVGDYFRGSGQHIDTVITDIDTVNETITLCIDAASNYSSGSLSTTTNAYKIQRPKIEGGKQTRIEHFAPTTIHNQTGTGVLSHIFIKGLKGVPYPTSTNLPRDFNVENNSTSSDWSSEIAKFTVENFISTAPRVVRDTTITSGGAGGSATIVVADSSDIKPGDSVMARGISYLTHVFDVDYSTNTIKITKDCEFTVTGNVRFYERLKVAPDVTESISNREVQLKHCINIFDFDSGTVPENSRPYWWPNVHHTPHRDYSYQDAIAQYKAFADTQKHPMGKWLITSYQLWNGVYQNPDGTATGEWTKRRDRARWAAELYPENFFDLGRYVYTEAESWYQANALLLYQHGWEKTFIEMGSGAISGAPTSGTYTNGDPLMDGDMWNDDSSGSNVRYVLLLTTGDATHDAAQQSVFGGTYTIPTTTGQGIWITLSSYSTLTGSGTMFSNFATTRQLTHNGVTYQGSALDVFRKSSPRIGKRDSAHSNQVGKRLLGYLIGQELLRRGW
jgi:hypothetical protein